MSFTNITTLTLTLEWFLNPDHLPFIAGIHTGAYKQAGLDVRIIEPDDHYDGFSELNDQNIDLHINEPIHLFEHYSAELHSLGCFFETNGGILMRQSSMCKLNNNEPIRICTPASEEKTNRIGFEILKRYSNQYGFGLTQDNVNFIQTDFYHINNMQHDPSIDGAWLCFYNFEAMEAQHVGMDFTFIDQNLSPFPNFSALEIITTRQTYQKKKTAIDTFIDITNQMIQLCQTKTDLAHSIYYEYTNADADELMDSIINDTLNRFINPIQPDKNRWKNLRHMLSDINIVSLTDEQYELLWKPI